MVDLLAEGAEPGLMAIQSGRFFGWVMAGTLPAALAADWLVSAWDQNAGMRSATPAVGALEDVAGQWLLDLLGLPDHCDVGFVTGATMANFTGEDERTRAIIAFLIGSGEVWMSGSRWQGRDVMRVSVSNCATTPVDVERAVRAVARAVAATD